MNTEKNFLDSKVEYLRAKRDLFENKKMSDMEEINLMVSQVLDIFNFAVTECSAKKNPKILLKVSVKNFMEFFLEDSSGTMEIETANDIERYVNPVQLKRRLNIECATALEKAGRKHISKKELEEFLKLLSEYCYIDRTHAFLGMYFIQLK